MREATDSKDGKVIRLGPCTLVSLIRIHIYLYLLKLMLSVALAGLPSIKDRVFSALVAASQDSVSRGEYLNQSNWQSFSEDVES